MATKDGKRLGEHSFLHMLRQRKIKVLIDAGAQIVEMDNLTLIRTWLEIDTSAPAGLYFDDDNKPWIYSRNSNTKTPLLASSYADGLHECLIYLDEVCIDPVSVHPPSYLLVRIAADTELLFSGSHTRNGSQIAAGRLRCLDSRSWADQRSHGARYTLLSCLWYTFGICLLTHLPSGHEAAATWDDSVRGILRATGSPPEHP
jgi:hypothetical protein